ncbi:MAG: hypothetical protein NTX48_05655 [Planctomycetales bacterium]|nr:hypothetical protein [Planctomycetales bacterium]
MSLIRIFTSRYPEKSVSRCKELLTVLERNLANSTIDSVCLLLEETESPFPDGPKLSTRPVSYRPKYNDFFDWANELVESPLDISIIANSDIYFDSTLLALANSLKPHQCAALSRWDAQADQSLRLFDRNDSQDAWIFRGKIRPMNADFCVGIPRCDNRILYELCDAGYEVINPAFSVRACHVHMGERGEYPAEINGPHVAPPYAYLYPHNLLNLPQTLIHNVKHPDRRIGWRLDRRLLRKHSPFSLVRRLGGSVLRWFRGEVPE